MRKVVLSILLSFVCLSYVFSQFDAQLSQYMFHNSAFNPAAVGEGNLIQITAQYRNQWMGMPNAPATFIGSINSPLKVQKSLHGIGIRVLNENVGLFTNRTAHLQYAYKKRIGTGTISLGTDIGFVSLGFRGDSVRKITLGTYHEGTDLQIPTTSIAGMSFDMNVGLFYSTPKLYTGFSYSHLNNPTVYWGDKYEFKMNGTLYFTGGYNWALPNPKFILKPSTLLKSDFRSMQLDVSTRLEYDNKYWGGLSYRIQDAVVFMAGINTESGLSIGCSYDVTTSQISTVSSGSLEFILVYSFEYVSEKRTCKYKSIRLL